MTLIKVTKKTKRRTLLEKEKNERKGHFNNNWVGISSQTEIHKKEKDEE